jgi:hypothetical protein
VAGDLRLLDSPESCRRRRSIDLNALVEPYVGSILAGLAAAVLVLLLLVVVQARRIGRLGRRLEGLTRGQTGRSLEAVLDAHLDKVFEVGRELDELAARSVVLEAGARKMIQRVGLVRYNPFEETGGNQSFALAMLDARGDGIVVSSLHARAGTRVYAKAVTNGRAEAALSDEESEAVRQALAASTEAARGVVTG